MKRTITAKAKSTGNYVKDVKIKLNVTFESLTVGEAKGKTEQFKNALHDFLRTTGAFNHSEIKIT